MKAKTRRPSSPFCVGGTDISLKKSTHGKESMMQAASAFILYNGWKKDKFQDWMMPEILHKSMELLALPNGNAFPPQLCLESQQNQFKIRFTQPSVIHHLFQLQFQAVRNMLWFSHLLSTSANLAIPISMGSRIHRICLSWSWGLTSKNRIWLEWIGLWRVA